MSDYRHTQIGWVILASIAAVGAILALALVPAGLGGVALAIGALLGAVALLFASLTVVVDRESVRFWFGPGLIRKRIALADVRAYRPVRNSWLFGWGIRFYGGGILYNVSGLDAVELVLNGGKRLRIGTDDPGGLSRALRDRIGDKAPLSEEESAAAASRTRRWLAVGLGIAALIAAAVGGLLWGESRPPRSWIDERGLHVSSLVYGADVPLAEIAAVELVDRLPPIRARTNGTALGSTRRGHFRLEAWGDGRLFLELDAPPFLVVKTRGSFVAIGYANGARTRALHDELRARLRPGPR